MFCSWDRNATALLTPKGEGEYSSFPLSPSDCALLEKGLTIKVLGVEVARNGNSEVSAVSSSGLNSAGFCKRGSVVIDVTWIKVRVWTDSLTAQLSPQGLVTGFITSFGVMMTETCPGLLISAVGLTGVYHPRLIPECGLQRLYTGQATMVSTSSAHPTLIIPDLTSGLRITGVSTVCHANLWATSDPFLVVANSSSFPAPPVTDPRVVSWSSLVNTAVEFTLTSSKVGLLSIQNVSILNFSKLEAAIRREVIHSSAGNPEMLGFQLMGRPGWSVVVAGEVVKILECNPVEVQLSPGDTCFVKLPVVELASNKSMFMDPVHRGLAS